MNILDEMYKQNMEYIQNVHQNNMNEINNNNLLIFY